MADAALDVADAALAAGRPGRRRRHHQPAGRRPSCGTAPRASRSARPSAGRTCARSASASTLAGRGPPRSRRTSRPPRSPGCSTPTTPTATGDLCFGTVDTWIAWTLSGGALHVTDRSQRRRHRPAATSTAATGTTTCSTRCASRARCCRRIVDSTGVLGAGHRAARRAADRRHRRRPAGVADRPGLRRARAWPRSPSAPAACSTCARRRRARRRRAGARPARSRSSPGDRTASITWGVEAIMLSAGTNVEWLRDDLGLLGHAGRVPRRRRAVRRHRRRRLRARAARPRHAALGLRRPRHAARPHPRHRPRRRSCGPCSRASPSAAPTSSRRPRPTPASPSPALRVDGGMSANPTFVQALADATGRAGRGLARGRGDDARRRLPRRPGRRHLVRASTTAAAGVAPRAVVEPGAPLDRDRVARGRRPGVRAGFPTCPPSTSRVALLCGADRRLSPSSIRRRRPAWTRTDCGAWPPRSTGSIAPRWTTWRADARPAGPRARARRLRRDRRRRQRGHPRPGHGAPAPSSRRPRRRRPTTARPPPCTTTAHGADHHDHAAAEQAAAEDLVVPGLRPVARAGRRAGLRHGPRPARC